MYGLESSNVSKREKLFEDLLTSIEQEEQETDVLWIFIHDPRREKDNHYEAQLSRSNEDLPINAFTDPVESEDIRIIIWNDGVKKWVIRNWQRVIPEAKESILNISQKGRDFQFLYDLKNGKITQEGKIEELVEEIRRKE